MFSLLIADDEAAIREGLSRLIVWEKIGFYCVDVVENGRQAIEHISHLHPDVALVDICMPEFSGIDVAKYVFEHQLPTEVVLLSAFKDFEFARSAMQYNVRHYIVKSARSSEIIHTFSALRDELCTRRPAGGAEERDEPLLNEIKRHIAQNLATATLESVSAHVNRHPSYVSQYFKAATGMLFSHYLTQTRMEYAARLLSDVRMHVYEVSEITGYANAQNFARAFRQYYQMTPREWREQNGITATEDI